MADLRIVFDINGLPPIVSTTMAFGNTITFDSTQSGDSAAVGLAVTGSGDGQCDLVADAQSVIGQLKHVQKNGQCTVQLMGGVKLPGGNGATLTDGTKIVGALGAASAKGFIRSVAAATLAEVAVARHLILSAADPTNVQVFLS